MPVGSEEYTIKNLNEKTNAEIEGFIKKSKEELFNLRFQHATGQLENTARLKAVKRDIMGCILFCANVNLASARPGGNRNESLRRSNG